MSFEELCKEHSIKFQTKASSQNDFGEWTYTHTTATSGTSCRLSPVSAAERLDPTGIYKDVKYICIVPSSTSITRGNRLVAGSDTYLIKDVILDSTSHHKSCLLTWVK